jgi:hypothetical protein
MLYVLCAGINGAVENNIMRRAAIGLRRRRDRADAQKDERDPLKSTTQISFSYKYTVAYNIVCGNKQEEAHQL